MISFPSDTYMRALAEALYAVSYLEWAVLGDLARLSTSLPDVSVERLSRVAMGAVATAVRDASGRAVSSAEAAWLGAAADALEEVVEARNRVVHAHPATIDGQQMLYRWAAPTKTKPHEALEITEEDLVALRDLACQHLRRMNSFRLPG